MEGQMLRPKSCTFRTCVPLDTDEEWVFGIRVCIHKYNPRLTTSAIVALSFNQRRTHNNNLIITIYVCKEIQDQLQFSWQILQCHHC